MGHSHASLVVAACVVGLLWPLQGMGFGSQAQPSARGGRLVQRSRLPAQPMMLSRRAGRTPTTPRPASAAERSMAAATNVTMAGFAMLALAFLAFLLLLPSPIDDALQRAQPLRSDRFKVGSGFVRVSGTLEATEEMKAPISGRPCVLWELALVAPADDFRRPGMHDRWRGRDIDILTQQRWWADGLSVRDVDGPVLLDLDAPRIFMPGSTRVFAARPEHRAIIREYLSQEDAEQVFQIREQVLAAGAVVQVAGVASRIAGKPSLGGHDLVISGGKQVTAPRPWAPWVVAVLAAGGLACIVVGVMLRPNPGDDSPHSGHLEGFER